jgi:hypothetical protein
MMKLELGQSTNAHPSPLADPKVQAALDNARSKLEAKARHECSLLHSNLGLILRDFTDQYKIETIGWTSGIDRIEPALVLEMLCARLGTELAELMYKRFLERFTSELLELDAQERRSQ